MTGIYKITNTTNNKFYIGSSKDIYKRYGQHLNNLKNNNHNNIYLQSAYNKYGKGSFKLEIVELCTENQLLDKEQIYLNKMSRVTHYNLANKAVGGGSNVLENPLILFDYITGEAELYKSGAEIAKKFDKRNISYSIINNFNSYMKSYWLFTPQYYDENYY